MHNRIRKPSFSELQRFGRNRRHFLSDGLIGHWLMNERVGDTAFDSSDSRNHGTLINMPYGAWTAGREDNGTLDFNGVNNYVNMGDINRLAMSWSIGAWIKTPNYLPTTNRIIIARSGGSPLWSQNYILLVNYSETPDSFGVGSSADNYIRARSATVPASGRWYHLVGTFDSVSKVYTIYVDGKSDGTATGTALPPTDANQIFQIGASDGSAAPANWFSGFIDNIRIYNRALSADEVWELYINPYSDFRIQSELWNIGISGAVPTLHYYQKLMAGN